MLIKNHQTITVGPWIWALMGLHLLVWTVAPILMRYNLAMDALEGVTWGSQWQWGYDKNPFMNAWLAELAIQLGGPSGWATYLFSQLSVVICFWAIFQLGKKILSPLYGLLGVLLLEGMQYYHFHAIDFSDNTVELSTWALTILFYYQAIKKNQLKDWLLTGFFAGLALMTKYYSAVLFASMGLYLLYNSQARRYLRRPYFYFAAIVFVMIILPHGVWLVKNNFITVHYMLQRTDSLRRFTDHLFFPAQFAWQQCEVFLPTLFLLSVLLLEKNPLAKRSPQLAHADDKQFLYFVGLGPFVLTVLLSLITGIKLRAGWGMPLLSCWGLIAMLIFRPSISPQKFYRFLFFILSWVLLNCFIYCWVYYRASDTSSAIFPGKTIAQQLTQRWHQQFHTPLRFVAGTRWIAGNIALYSPDRPAVFINWDKKTSPWIDEKNLKKYGAIFVWDPQAKEKITVADIQKLYPGLKQPEILRFAWRRNGGLPPVEVQVVWVGPLGEE